MILPYFLRLLCLSLASFFLLHLALGIATRIVAPFAIHFGESLRPRFASRLFFALRMLPATLAISIVVGLCLPSYLWLEPEATSERVGLACLAAALLGAAAWAVSVHRAIRAVADSLKFSRDRQELAWEAYAPGEPHPIAVLEEEAPLLALAGIVRPQIVISDGVLRALSSDQLAAAVRHEQAHRASRDNFKRLLLLLAPDVIPFAPTTAALDRCWARVTEWAADDEAIAGDAERSLSLAAALVRVARMGRGPVLSPLVNALVSGEHELRERVDRMLGPASAPEIPRRGIGILLSAVELGIIPLFVGLLLRANTFYSIHQLLERLIH